MLVLYILFYSVPPILSLNQCTPNRLNVITYTTLTQIMHDDLTKYELFMPRTHTRTQNLHYKFTIITLITKTHLISHSHNLYPRKWRENEERERAWHYL